MYVLFVQLIAISQIGIEHPNTSKQRSKWLKKRVQYEELVLYYKIQLDICETEIKQITAIENKGESII